MNTDAYTLEIPRGVASFPSLGSSPLPTLRLPLVPSPSASSGPSRFLLLTTSLASHMTGQIGNKMVRSLASSVRLTPHVAFIHSRRAVKHSRRPLNPPAPTFNRPRPNVSSSRPAFICYRPTGTQRDSTGPNGSQ